MLGLVACGEMAVGGVAQYASSVAFFALDKRLCDKNVQPVLMDRVCMFAVDLEQYSSWHRGGAMGRTLGTGAVRQRYTDIPSTIGTTSCSFIHTCEISSAFGEAGEAVADADADPPCVTGQATDLAKSCVVDYGHKQTQTSLYVNSPSYWLHQLTAVSLVFPPPPLHEALARELIGWGVWLLRLLGRCFRE